MITGDHITTAKAISIDLGIINSNQLTNSSSDLSKMSDEELFYHIKDYSVYARICPTDKIQIVSAWQEKVKFYL